MLVNDKLNVHKISCIFLLAIHSSLVIRVRIFSVRSVSTTGTLPHISMWRDLKICCIMSHEVKFVRSTKYVVEIYPCILYFSAVGDLEMANFDNLPVLMFNSWTFYRKIRPDLRGQLQ